MIDAGIYDTPDFHSDSDSFLWNFLASRGEAPSRACGGGGRYLDAETAVYWKCPVHWLRQPVPRLALC